MTVMPIWIVESSRVGSAISFESLGGPGRALSARCRSSARRALMSAISAAAK